MKTGWLAILALSCAGLLTACGSGGGGTGGTGGGGGGGQTTSGSSTFHCCLNDQSYDCPDQAATDECAGKPFDVGACLAACNASDPTCAANCSSMGANSMPNP